MKKTGVLYTIAILLCVAAANCAAQVVPAEQQASPTFKEAEGFIVHGSAQSITLPPISGQSVDSPPLQLSASDNTGSAVNFETLTPWVCRVSNNVVTFLSNESCTIAADRGGNGMFVSTTRITRNLTGCIDCSTVIPTLPQWCAIVMGLILIGLSIFLIHRSNSSTIA